MKFTLGWKLRLPSVKGWFRMPEIKSVSDGKLDTIQAMELAMVVDLEARWENLRTTAQNAEVPATVHNLHGKQKAYEAFRIKLAAYNKRFAPAHIPELLLNTSARLGTWCRAMRKLYLQIENDPQGHCPVHLLEKAYRWADLVARKENKATITRSTPPATIRAAIGDLDTLCQWCADLAIVTPAA
jgi:hypothetical protein